MSPYFDFCCFPAFRSSNRCSLYSCCFTSGSCNAGPGSCYPIISNCCRMPGTNCHRCCPEGSINPVCMNNPVCTYYNEWPVIMSSERMPYMPAKRSPGPPPARVISPSPGRNPGAVNWSVYKTDRRPEPNINYNSRRCKIISRIRSAEVAGIEIIEGFIFSATIRLHNYLFAINIFIPDYLYHCSSIAGFFQFDDSDILVFCFRNGDLEYKSMNFFF